MTSTSKARGTLVHPWICFGHDYDTGILLDEKGRVRFTLDGIERSMPEFLAGIRRKCQIDDTHMLTIASVVHIMRQLDQEVGKPPEKDPLRDIEETWRGVHSGGLGRSIDWLIDEVKRLRTLIEEG